jgi:hypothetical protein
MDPRRHMKLYRGAHEIYFLQSQNTYKHRKYIVCSTDNNNVIFNNDIYKNYI